MGSVLSIVQCRRAAVRSVCARCTWDCRGGTAGWSSAGIGILIKMNLGWTLEGVAVRSSQGRQIQQHKQRHRKEHVYFACLSKTGDFMPREDASREHSQSGVFARRS